MKNLTPRQRRFVAEYVIDLNAKAAAIRSGYSGKWANIVGWKLLHRPAVVAAIAQHEKDLFDRLRITAEHVLIQTARIAFADQRRLFKPDGTLKEIADIDDDTIASVSIEIVETDAGSRWRTKRKIRPRDPVPALKLLGRHIALWRGAEETPSDPVLDGRLVAHLERAGEEAIELEEFRRQAAAKRLEGPSE